MIVLGSFNLHVSPFKTVVVISPCQFNKKNHHKTPVYPPPPPPKKKKKKRKIIPGLSSENLLSDAQSVEKFKVDGYTFRASNYVSSFFAFLLMNEWMTQFYILFNSISVISGQ